MAYIIPYMLVYGPSLLMQGGPIRIGVSVITACFGVIAFTAVLQGLLRRKCRIWERIILVISGFSLIHSGLKTDLFGVLLLVGIWGYQQFGRPVLRDDSRTA